MKVRELTRRLTSFILSGAVLGAVLMLVFLFPASEAFAVVQKSQSLGSDSRFRFLNYQPNSVYEYTGYLRSPSRIEFDPKEEITSITMGDPTGWQISPAGSRLFLKPTEVEATTNMVVFTNKRIYYFELYSKESQNLNDPEIPFATTFYYTDDSSVAADKGFYDVSDKAEKKTYVPDTVKDAAMLNMNYTMSGDKTIAPIEAFDDGEFTYFKFRNINADYPAIFQVLPDGNEGLVNYRISDNGYVVIERVTSQFTLRFGAQMACVFNEKMPLVRAGKKDKNTSSFGIF